ncbi:hypothetical protein LIER_05914 [Lithospermum erythrorhizon]|uniref:BZIP domain-containing protein n=1 Tax=Lithospermum erythrorhizon TaxID=34254 RepID=A0AAV3P3L2_LITER
MSQMKPTSSCSSQDDHRYAMMDEKKRKRMISNRESARRSRMKREQHIKGLNDQIFYYTNKNREMASKINDVMQRFTPLENENKIMTAQKEELSKRLESLEMMTSYYNEPNEFSSFMDATYQEPWINPWEPQTQYQPIMTSASGDFHF